MKNNQGKLSSKRGVILLTAAGLMFGLLAFVGLAFDVGYLQWSRRRAQTAADAGALAGAWAKQLSGAVVAEGQSGSAVNGFTHGQNGITVTINNPPTAGSYIGDATAVEAIVAQDTGSYFLRILNWNTLPIRARAVARQGYGTACVYALDPNARPGLRFSGNTGVNLGCGAIVASTMDPAVNVGGTATVTMTNGASIGSVGDYDADGSGSINPPTSISGGAPFPGDPLITLPMPTYSTQPCWNGTTMIAGPCTDNANLPTGTYQPGVYCGGITINSGSVVNLLPGVYILAGGGGLRFNGGTTTANGVTFYVTDTDTWPCSGFHGSQQYPSTVTMNSSAGVTLTAPVEGVYAGIALMVNRDLTGSHAPSPNHINGGAGFVLDGAIYMPNSPLSFEGNSDSNGYLMLIAATLDFTGGATLNLNNFPTAFANNNPAFKKWVVLGE